MSSQSVVVPLPVLMKDEKRYADLMDVLDQMEAWVREIYAKAGLCAPVNEDHIPPGPPTAAPSHPDQLAAHVPPVPGADDPLAKIRIPCFGDQLTRVRIAGAKDLRAGCHTPQDRLDHLYPFMIVDWHTKWSFLKVHTYILYLLYNNYWQLNVTFPNSVSLKILVSTISYFKLLFFLTPGSLKPQFPPSPLRKRRLLRVALTQVFIVS